MSVHHGQPLTPVADHGGACQSLETRFEVEPDVCQAQVRAFAGQLVEAGFARFC